MNSLFTYFNPKNDDDKYNSKEYYNGKYHGELKDDKRNGQGTLTYDDGKVIYKGQWKNNKRHGQGTMTYADGSTYVGKWKDDMIDGDCKIYYTSNDFKK